MKDKKRHKQFERFALKLIAKYQPKLLLDRHIIELEASNKATYMECHFRVPYLDTVIRYNPDKIMRDWSAGKLSDLRHAVIHELCHVVTDPLYAKANDRYVDKDTMEEVRENLTDHIAMIVRKNKL